MSVMGVVDAMEGEWGGGGSLGEWSRGRWRVGVVAGVVGGCCCPVG